MQKNQANTAPNNKATHKIFGKEKDCLDYVKDKPNLHIFSEDVNPLLAKRFIADTYAHVFRASQTKKLHLYENYQSDDKLKLFLDIDIKTESFAKNVDLDACFKSTLRTAMKLVNTNLKKYNINDPKVIVLSSSRQGKLSAHLIYQNVAFHNIHQMKQFMMELESKLIVDKVIDMNIYKKGCFRMLWSSKYGVKVPLEYYGNTGYEIKDDETLFMDCLLKNISPDSHFVNVVVPEIVNKPLPVKNNQVKNNPKQPNQKKAKAPPKQKVTPLNILKKFLGLLGLQRAEDYGDWIRIGIVLKSCNPKSFDLWDEWSHKVTDPSDTAINKYKWSTFPTDRYTIGTLKYYAKHDNPQQYNALCKRKNKKIVDLPNCIKFCAKYLTKKKDETIKSLKSFASKHIHAWAVGDMKILAIKSPYNTAKTKMIEKIIKEYGIDRVLFVSYRQTLTQDFFGSFNILNVESYLDGSYTADRVICQIESLHRLSDHTKDIYGGGMEIPKYDLVILDEVESILNHFRSTTVHQKEETFDLLKSILWNSGKILALDGDLGLRSTDFLSYFGDFKVLHNTVKKNLKHFVFTQHKKNFDADIRKDLADKKNTAIVCMSSKMANHYYEQYNGKYTTILHCAKSDDHLKNNLKKVNDFWDKYQCLIYTPSVEAGVNFDKKHFDKIYAVISVNSTSPRGFMQMLSRIRQLENSTIKVYLNCVSERTDLPLFEYDDVKHYVETLYAKHIKPRFVLREDEYVKIYDNDLYKKVLIHSEVEIINKCPGMFMSTLVKLLKEKGHTYEFGCDGIKRGKKRENVLEELVKADDIDEPEYQRIVSAQKMNKAFRAEKIQAEKYLIKKYWGVKEITDDFLKKYYGKNQILFNLRNLMWYAENKPKISDKGKWVNFDKIRDRERMEMILEIVSGLGFTFGQNIVLKKEVFEENIDNFQEKSKFFMNSAFSSRLFGFSVKKMNELDSSYSFIRFINAILNSYGLHITCTSTAIRIKEEEKGNEKGNEKESKGKTKRKIKAKTKVTHLYTYILDYWKDIDHYANSGSDNYPFIDEEEDDYVSEDEDASGDVEFDYNELVFLDSDSEDQENNSSDDEDRNI